MTHYLSGNARISRRNHIALAVAMACSSIPAMANDAFTDALKGGKASVNARLRYENVVDKAFTDSANALTFRSRVGYETAPLHGFTVLAEFEDIRLVGGTDDFALPPPPTPAAGGFAIVADPEMTEVNRAQIRYRGIPRLDLVLGRQRLIFDNQRFIGNVGFRQDEQTYDGLSAIYTGLPDFTFSYAYIDEVNGFGSTGSDRTSVFDADTNDHLFNASYNGFTWGKFIAYSYNLSNQNDTLKGPAALIDVNAGLRYINNDTNGIRFEGAYILPTTVSLRALYRAEYARQKADIMAGTPSKETAYKADYKLLEAGMAWTFGGGSYALIPTLGYEVLGSDDGNYGLQTPYATKHAFNGWVDQFLVTPKEGLEDIYLNLGFDLNSYAIKTLLTWHEYASDEKNVTTGKGLDFGTEYGAHVLATIGANWIIGAKFATYNADKDDLGVTKKPDARKGWIWAEFNF